MFGGGAIFENMKKYTSTPANCDEKMRENPRNKCGRKVYGEPLLKFIEEIIPVIVCWPLAVHRETQLKLIFATIFRRTVWRPET